MLKGETTVKTQAARNTESYSESPTGVMQPASVRTTEMREAPIQKMPVIQATSVQQSQPQEMPAMQKMPVIQSTSVQKSPPQAMPTTDNKKTGYFKPGTMAEYLEERRRKMRGNLMIKR